MEIDTRVMTEYGPGLVVSDNGSGDKTRILVELDSLEALPKWMLPSGMIMAGYHALYGGLYFRADSVTRI